MRGDHHDQEGDSRPVHPKGWRAGKLPSLEWYDLQDANVVRLRWHRRCSTTRERAADKRPVYSWDRD